MSIKTFKNVILQIVHDTIENFNNNNPILKDGEMGYVSGGDEINTIKFGDGKKNWKTLKEFVPNESKNSNTVNGYRVEKDVPSNAIFTDTTYDVVSSISNGLMSSDDKIKLDNMSEKLDTKSETITYTTIISTSWEGMMTAEGEIAPYTQNVSISEIKATDNPLVDIIFNDDYIIAMQEQEEYSKISRIQTSDGSILITCFEEKPEVEINIQLKVVR